MIPELERYLALDWRIGPCRARTKRAFVPWTEFSSDPRVVRRWDRQCPSASWAVVLEDLVVLDVENEAGDDEIHRRRRAGMIPICPISLSGGWDQGYHLYFRRPAGRELRPQVWIVPGEIEARTGNMLMMLPPSLHESGRRYRWETSYAPWRGRDPRSAGLASRGP